MCMNLANKEHDVKNLVFVFVFIFQNHSAMYIDEHSLKPIQSGRGRKLEVHEIINKTAPTLNSYSRSKPLPAIIM